MQVRIMGVKYRRKFVVNRLPGDSLSGSSSQKYSWRKSEKAGPSELPKSARLSLAKEFRWRVASLSLDIAKERIH